MAALSVSAQDISALRKAHAWSNDPVWQSEWDMVSDGTEVLRDELSIRFRNTKPQFLSVFFERRQVIRFANETDILRHGRFVLPESLDPPYDRRLSPWAARSGPALPLWYNVRLDHFAARIVRPDGTWSDVPVLGRVARQEVKAIRTMETAWSYLVDLETIAPGDVVEVTWKYMVPYNTNWATTQGWRAYEWLDNWSRLTSWRVFFHGVLPIRDQRVSMTYDLKHGVVLGGTAADSEEVNGNEVVRTWEKNALAGCMDEVNAHPAEDLPFITVLLAPQDLRYWRRDRLSGIAVEQPYWMMVLRTREEKAFWWKQVAKKRVPDRQNKLLKAFIERNAGHLPDSLATRRMEVLHEAIAEDFVYEADRLWYQNIDLGLPRMGDQVQDERLRDISRYDLYAKLANAVKAPYSTAYVMDRRIGRMNDLWMSQLWDSEFLFGLRDGDGMAWMHPKRTRIGWYADELPFYWQSSAALLMDLEHLISDYSSPPLFVDLPGTEDAVNMRATEFTLNVDMDRSEVRGTARVLLSGQFSTLGRAAYHDAAIDSTVDPLYGHRPTDASWIHADGPAVMEASSQPPFRFRVEQPLHSGHMLATNGDGSFSMDVAPLIAHVVPRDLTAEGRDLPFYWDFPQQDRVIIDLHFSRPVEVMDASALQEIRASPGARYWIGVHKINARHIRIESLFEVWDEREEVGSAIQVEQVCRSACARERVLRLYDDEHGP